MSKGIGICSRASQIIFGKNKGYFQQQSSGEGGRGRLCQKGFVLGCFGILERCSGASKLIESTSLFPRMASDGIQYEFPSIP